MSVETLASPEQAKGTAAEITPGLVTAIGKTVFEELAVDTNNAVERPDGSKDLRLINSVTHLGDGQQVPDER